MELLDQQQNVKCADKKQTTLSKEDVRNAILKNGIDGIKNSVICSDCLEVMKDIPDESIDLVCTDPPYRVISGGNKHKDGVGWKGSILEKNDGKIFTHNDIKFEEWIPEVFRILKDGSHFYTMTNTLNLEKTLTVCREAGFGLHNVLIWKKNNQVLNRWYMKSCEYILFLYKKPAKKINIVGTSQVLEFNNPRNKKHPTEKPVELMEIMITNSTKECDTVLDLFAGSGTTGVACKNLNRNYILIEKEAEYIDIINRRLNNR